MAASVKRCAHCKAALTLASTGRPRRYCSDSCRVAAFRRRRREARGLRCLFCKGTLTLVRNGGESRRYCSLACRAAAFRKRWRQSVHFSSRTPEWSTPPDFFAELWAEYGPFDLDPCATSENAKCARYFTREDDGLAQEWTGRVFMNPPYGREIGAWMRKAWEASQTTAELVVCLVPARTDTAWWHDYAAHGEFTLLRGRLRFGEAEASAPFPSVIVVFRHGLRYDDSVTNAVTQHPNLVAVTT